VKAFLPTLLALAFLALVVLFLRVWPAQVFPWFVEDGVVESLLAIAYLFASGCLLLLLRREQRAWPIVLLTVLTILIFFEEISWGQRLFGFHTPEALRAFNRQGEFNLHNSN